MRHSQWSRASRMLLAAVAIATQMFVLTGSVAAASPPQGSCPANDTSKVKLWENREGDTNSGDDSLWLCGNTINLSLYAHEPSGACQGTVFGSSTWNDCISSWTVWVPSGWRLVLYRDDEYDGWIQCLPGPRTNARVNAPSANNDTLTSFRWLQGTSCP